MTSNFRLFFPLAKTQVRANVIPRASNYSSDVGEIKIPKRIRRGPTDILKALSSTVGVDPTAAHYKYHDDPYLMPYSNPAKRSYALSQEAGRKAAQWVRQRHADLFQHKVADPTIEAYVPRPDYSVESNASEDVLEKLIATQQVSDVMTVYQILKKRGVDVGVETKQKILELVCFYNSKDPLSDEWIEELWFQQSNMKSKAEYFKKTWKDDGIAEIMFEEVTKSGGDPSKAYCALIAGMLTHGQCDRGFKLFEEAKQKGVELNVVVYNALLGKTSLLREAHDMIWQLVVELLNEMNSRGLRPNVGTLNAILLTLEFTSRDRNSRANALGTVAEFKQLGVQPSLASFAHLLRIFQRDPNQLSGVIHNILDHLEKDNTLADPRTPEDNRFFMRAMEAINDKLGDRDLAVRLDNVLHKVKNYSLVGTSFYESIYYRHYFRLMMNTSSIDDFMEFYYKFVPNIYVPEISIFKELMTAVEDQMGWKYVKKLWGDMILFDQLRVEGVTQLLSLTVQAAQGEDFADEMAEVGWSIWEKIQSGTVRNFEWSGEMLGDILNLLSIANHLSKAHIVFDHINRHQDGITGEPSVGSLEKYIDTCLGAGNIEGALKCVRYADERNLLETEKFVKKISGCGIKLDGPQERVVNELLRKF